MLGCLHLRLRNMCPLVLCLIMNMYISQRMQVRFGTAMSSHFSISNGVKQGGILSPILFTIYSNNLIIQLILLQTYALNNVYFIYFFPFYIDMYLFLNIYLYVLSLTLPL